MKNLKFKKIVVDLCRNVDVMEVFENENCDWDGEREDFLKSVFSDRVLSGEEINIYLIENGVYFSESEEMESGEIFVFEDSKYYELFNIILENVDKFINGREMELVIDCGDIENF